MPRDVLGCVRGRRARQELGDPRGIGQALGTGVHKTRDEELDAREFELTAAPQGVDEAVFRELAVALECFLRAEPVLQVVAHAEQVVPTVHVGRPFLDGREERLFGRGQALRFVAGQVGPAEPPQQCCVPRIACAVALRKRRGAALEHTEESLRAEHAIQRAQIHRVGRVGQGAHVRLVRELRLLRELVGVAQLHERFGRHRLLRRFLGGTEPLHRGTEGFHGLREQFLRRGRVAGVLLRAHLRERRLAAQHTGFDGVGEQFLRAARGDERLLRFAREVRRAREQHVAVAEVALSFARRHRVLQTRQRVVEQEPDLAAAALRDLQLALREERHADREVDLGAALARAPFRRGLAEHPVVLAHAHVRAPDPQLVGRGGGELERGGEGLAGRVESAGVEVFAAGAHQCGGVLRVREERDRLGPRCRGQRSRERQRK